MTKKFDTDKVLKIVKENKAAVFGIAGAAAAGGVGWAFIKG